MLLGEKGRGYLLRLDLIIGGQFSALTKRTITGCFGL